MAHLRSPTCRVPANQSIKQPLTCQAEDRSRYRFFSPAAPIPIPARGSVIRRPNATA